MLQEFERDEILMLTLEFRVRKIQKHAETFLFKIPRKSHMQIMT